MNKSQVEKITKEEHKEVTAQFWSKILCGMKLGNGEGRND